jgi:hypothetical protein
MYVCIRFKLCVRYLRLAILESAYFTFKVEDGRNSVIRYFGSYLQTSLRRHFIFFSDRASQYITVNKTQLGAQFFLYIYFYSIHVSGNHVPIIRRINCINTIPGICHSVWMTISHPEWQLCTKLGFIYKCLRRPLSGNYLFYAERRVLWFSQYLFFVLAVIFLR